MVDGIEIIIKEGIKEIINSFIYPKNNSIYINDKKYNIEDEKIREILNILALWDNDNYFDKKIDLQEYKIKVYSNNEITEYVGKSKYPETYKRLKDIIGEIQNGQV